MALWVGQVEDFYMKVIHYIPKLQCSSQQGMTQSTVIEHEYTQAVEINKFHQTMYSEVVRKKDYPKYIRTKRSKLLCSNHASVQIIVTQGRPVKLLTLSFFFPCYIDLVWDTRETTSLFEKSMELSPQYHGLLSSFHILCK